MLVYYAVGGWSQTVWSPIRLVTSLHIAQSGVPVVKLFCFPCLSEFETQQRMESQHQFIRAFQHAYITKISRRHREEHALHHVFATMPYQSV
jgi:hypothetical protein